MTITDSLRTALSELAAIRAASVTLNEAMHAAKAKFQAEHVELTNAINDHAERLRVADAQVRTLALAAWEMDKANKKPVPGITIKVPQVATYDAEQVMAWAREHRATFPKLITETLNADVLAKLIDADAVPGVTKKDDPKATIATDLSHYLPVPAATEECPF
jgi:hypothetical protein